MLTGSRLSTPAFFSPSSTTLSQSVSTHTPSTSSSHRIEVLAAESRQLSRTPLQETSYEASIRLQRLQQVNNQLGQEAVAIVEALMVDGQIGSSDMKLSLTRFSDNSQTPSHVKTASDFLLKNPARLSAMESESVTAVLGKTSTASALTMADIHARQLSLNHPIPMHSQVPDSTEHYQVPTKNDTYVTGTMDSPNRPAALYAKQQRWVASALRTGLPSSFRNSDGTDFSLTITPLRSDSNARYHVALDKVAQFRVRSSVSLSRTIEAIANIIEWGSTFDARSGLRTFPAVVRLDHKPHPTGNAAASYNGRTHTMTFYKGHQHVSESNYNHEMGHGIGWHLHQENTRQRGWAARFCPGRRQPYTPQQWESVTKAANNNGIDSMTRYAEKSLAEDFAESLSAYMNARDNGPAALAALRQAYPNRTAFLEKEIFQDDTRQ